jgi:hypothetical protein
MIAGSVPPEADGVERKASESLVAKGFAISLILSAI